jgi:hypothetical protein
MKVPHLPNFKDFNKSFEDKKIDEAVGSVSGKLKKATEDFHNAQLELQKLQKQFIALSKDDSSRESMKQKIIAQHKIVKQKEAIFAKAIGDEDIEDFEI